MSEYQHYPEDIGEFEIPAPDVFAGPLAAAWKALHRDDFPHDGICSHLGVTVPTDDFSVGLCVGAKVSPVFTVYTEKYFASASGPGKLLLEKAYWDAVGEHLERAIEHEFVERWNHNYPCRIAGKTGGVGCSYRLDARLTGELEALVVGNHNYRALDSPFNIDAATDARFKKWRRWFLSALAEEGAQLKT